ncbi:unnamed protein product [Spirodela intermedia]|uniref:Uncharacterized protein n=1 Tax=Spirodela intermedia TaxID=51605 RepID=A0A7I8K079_SPIIN|nr:unnamed protein product [Spirodela intermedia]
MSPPTFHFSATAKFLPEKVWPNFQSAGATFQEVEVRWSLPVMRKEMDCPTRTALDCQFCPQLRLIGIHPVLEPFTLTRSTSPAPATFVMSTRLKPAVSDGDDAGTVLGDLEEHGHGEVEVGTRRVAPAAIVGGEGKVRGAEVGGGDEDGGASAVAPPGIVGALDLEARPAAQPVVEEGRAQRCSLHAVALTVQVAIPACPPWRTRAKREQTISKERFPVNIPSQCGGKEEAERRREGEERYPWCRRRRCRRRRWRGRSPRARRSTHRECGRGRRPLR